MNERIRELAEKAREYANSKEPYEKIKNKAWIDVYDEKFAELIVKECMLRVRSRQQFATEDEQNVTQAFDLLIYDLESLFGVEP